MDIERVKEAVEIIVGLSVPDCEVDACGKVIDLLKDQQQEMERLKSCGDKFKESVQFIVDCMLENNEDITLMNGICDLYTDCYSPLPTAPA